MSKIILAKQPCIGATCDSSDGLQVYEKGDSFCWSCRTFFTKEETDSGMENTSKKLIIKKKDPQTTIEEIEEEYRCKGWRERGISTKVMEFFGVKSSYNRDGKRDGIFYPYPGGYKARKILPSKDFYFVGEHGGLFGMDKFQAGGKRLVITTGENDVLAVAEAMMDRYDRIYPVITAGSDANIKELLKEREWIRSFDEVILAFDNDESGQKALDDAIKIVGFDKVKIAKYAEKDPNEVLMKNDEKKLMQCLFDAAPYVPGGILRRDELWDKLVEFHNTKSMPFPAPMAGVNTKTKGKRYGEITLLISGTGSGKSTLLREDVLETLETTEDMVGILALEDGPGEMTRKLAAMSLKVNAAEKELSLEEIKPGFDAVFGSDRVMVLDHQGAVTDQSVMDKLEYMILSGCKHLYIDHITILVSEGVDGLTGNEAQDKIMNGLLRLVKKYPVWICLVSHLRKVQSGKQSFEEGKLPSMDDIRGSGSVKQVSFDIIAFARDMNSPHEHIRNMIKMAVLKCRFTGLTGPVAGARYNYETGRLEGVPLSEFDDTVETVIVDAP
jgi:twinkle protein